MTSCKQILFSTLNTNSFSFKRVKAQSVKFCKLAVRLYEDNRQVPSKRAGLIKTLAALTKILDVRPYSIMLWGKFFVEKLVASQ